MLSSLIFNPKHVTIRTQHEFAAPRRHDASAWIVEKSSNRIAAVLNLPKVPVRLIGLIDFVH
jgi:hypothetical protein